MLSTGDPHTDRILALAEDAWPAAERGGNPAAAAREAAREAREDHAAGEPNATWSPTEADEAAVAALLAAWNAAAGRDED
jgi:hypothetical protein